MNKIFNSQNKKKGFSMGEVLISVFILGVTMVTILQLFVVSLKNFASNRDSIIASMLAQEGIELVKNIRDNNWVNGDSTFNSINTTSSLACAIDSGDVSCGASNIVDCKFDSSADAHCSLYFNNNLYTHTHNGIKTKFKRSVKILSPGGNRKFIVSQVNWNPAKRIPNLSDCYVANKCVFSETILTTWGN